MTALSARSVLCALLSGCMQWWAGCFLSSLNILSPNSNPSAVFLQIGIIKSIKLVKLLYRIGLVFDWCKSAIDIVNAMVSICHLEKAQRLILEFECKIYDHND